MKKVNQMNKMKNLCTFQSRVQEGKHKLQQQDAYKQVVQK